MSKQQILRTLRDQLRIGTPQVIGYGEVSQAAFDKGYRLAKDQIWQVLARELELVPEPEEMDA